MTLWTLAQAVFAALCLGFALHRYRTRQPKEAIFFLGIALAGGGSALQEPWGTIVPAIGVVVVLVGSSRRQIHQQRAGARPTALRVSGQ